MPLIYSFWIGSKNCEKPIALHSSIAFRTLPLLPVEQKGKRNATYLFVRGNFFGDSWLCQEMYLSQ